MITNNKNCINLDNGLSKFLISQKGIFNLSCTIGNNDQLFNFSLYPNPSVDNYVIVRSASLSGVPRNFLIEIVAVGGRTGISRKVTTTELQNGVRIPLLSLQSGIYMIHISSDTDKLSGSQKLIVIK